MSRQGARLSFSVESLLALRHEERATSLQERVVSSEDSLKENDEFFDEEGQEKLNVSHLKQDKPNQRRPRRRVLFTESQIHILKSVFLKQKYLSAENQKKLAESLNLSPKQVKTWFQNYRYKCRRRSFSNGYRQPEDRPTLLGSTALTAPIGMSVPYSERSTVFFGNQYCSSEQYSSISSPNALYNEYYHPIVSFSYRFPSQYQHLPTVQGRQ